MELGDDEKQLLAQHWRSLRDDVQRHRPQDGDCPGRPTARGCAASVFDGDDNWWYETYGGEWHAEMRALSRCVDFENLGMVRISSPPCPACAVVLAKLQLTYQICAPQSFNNSVQSRNAPFEFYKNTFFEGRTLLELLIDGSCLTIEQRMNILKSREYELWVYFTSGDWR